MVWGKFQFRKSLFIYTRNCGFAYILVASQSCGFVRNTLNAHPTNLYIDYKTLVHNKYGLQFIFLTLIWKTNYL